MRSADGDLEATFLRLPCHCSETPSEFREIPRQSVARPPSPCEMVLTLYSHGGRRPLDRFPAAPEIFRRLQPELAIIGHFLAWLAGEPELVDTSAATNLLVYLLYTVSNVYIAPPADWTKCEIVRRQLLFCIFMFRSC
ncbi:hypothetical protein BDW72DRAFT_3031 [Aspergillus terricola var. indicus]